MSGTDMDSLIECFQALKISDVVTEDPTSEIIPPHSAALRTSQDVGDSAAVHSTASPKAARVRGFTRKACPEVPEDTPLAKRRKLSDGEPSPSPKESARVSGSDGKADPEKICQSKWRRVREKRKVRKDKTGPLTTKGDVQTLPLDDNEKRCKPLGDCSTSSGTASSRKRVRSQYRRAEAELENKYMQQELLGEGGCGSVFAGCRKTDQLPVAIKHVMKRNVFCKTMGEDGKQISVEIAIMQKLAEEKSGTSGAAVALLDWYDLGRELIMVMERPIPSVDLYHYIEASGGALPEEESKVIVQQLLIALKEMEDTKIFHRDIKTENILIQTISCSPRVRIIDFGLSCFTGKETQFRRCFGTPDHVTPEFCRRGTYSSGSCTVWQLGIVLFEMLNRGKTFETGMFLTNKIKITKRITRNCHNFLTSCLAKNPKDRPSLEDLQQHPWIR